MLRYGNLVDPIQGIPTHPTEEILEEYAFHRLPETITAQVEEHLLICPSCQDALAETDRFVSAFRLAAKKSPATGKLPTGRFPRFAIYWKIAIPACALVILAAVAIRKNPPEPLGPVAVNLSSVRGADPLPAAPAGRSLQLNIEAPDLTSGRQYRVELVDASGSLVWKGAATASDSGLAVAMPKPLSAGMHWVRLYGAGPELLREFSLSAK
jgi:hypothetical protein